MDDQITTSVFDAYCKRVIRNELSDCVKQWKRWRRFEAMVGTAVEDVPVLDAYPSEALMIEVNGYGCIVSSERLFHALLNLPLLQQQIIIMSAWEGMSDYQIAPIVGRPRRTITYQRNQGIKALKMLLRSVDGGVGIPDDS